MHKQENATHLNNSKYANGTDSINGVPRILYETILKQEPRHKASKDSNPLV